MPDMSNSFSRFLKALNLPGPVLQRIESARSIIEDELRKGIEAYTASPQGGGVKISPKFIPQGSMVYRTVNYPFQNPPQQVDFDLGVHLPVSYHENNTEPTLAARDYYTTVFGILERVAKANSWAIQAKERCIRIIVDTLTHIDVPLYSMPDKEFLRFTAALRTKGLVKEAQTEDFRMDSQRDFWDEFAFDHVMLCLKEGGWKASDPRKITKQVRALVAKHGEQLVSVWRFLKAWRDALWPKGGGPSSLYLMFAAAQTFQGELWRDDKALLSALRAFFNATSRAVPLEDGEDLKQSQKHEELLVLEQRAAAFATALSGAIDFQLEDGQAERAVQQHLGTRFPLPDPPVRAANSPDVSRTMSDAAKVESLRRTSTTRPWCP